MPDYLVSARGAVTGRVNARGSVFVFSGATGTLIRQHDGPEAQGGHGWGWSVTGLGDINFDGVDDYIVGAIHTEPTGLKETGSAFVFSGADGALIRRHDGTATTEYFDYGFSVARLGDVDFDGVADYIVGALGTGSGGWEPSPTGVLTDTGAAFLYSGADGSLIREHYGAAAQSAFGASVAGVGDVDSDGVDDYIVGAGGADPGGLTDAGSVFVFSGATGALIQRHDGFNADDNFGSSVAGLGDVSGDGADDYIVGASHADPGRLSAAGSAYLFAGLGSVRVLNPLDGVSRRPSGWGSSMRRPRPR